MAPMRQRRSSQPPNIFKEKVAGSGTRTRTLLSQLATVAVCGSGDYMMPSCSRTSAFRSTGSARQGARCL